MRKGTLIAGDPRTRLISASGGEASKRSAELKKARKDTKAQQRMREGRAA